MAHLFENLLTKRRNRSSNSSTEEYPGATKPRDTSDLSFQLMLSKTAKATMKSCRHWKKKKKLQEILQKLEKLDSVENR